MNTITLHFPVLIQNIKVEQKLQYYLRPLFFPHPVASDKRYDKAISKFQKEVKRYFKGFKLNRANAEDVLWFMFEPQIYYETYRMEFNSGKQYIRGRFFVVHFDLKGHRFVCLPAFNNFMYIAQKTEKGKYQIPQEAQQVIQKLIRKQKKATNNQTLDLSPYTATKGEFVTNLRFTVSIKDDEFPFEKDAEMFFFSRLSGGSNFDGAVEIEKVGYDLNERYPTDLGRAYFQDELVERLYKTVYQKENSPIVLIGSEGVGKHTLLHEMVYRYKEREADRKEIWLEKVWFINPNRIIAGMSIVGMWQKRFEAILRYVKNRRKKTKPHFNQGNTDKILIDNVIALLRIGKSAQNNMTLSDVLKPYLEKRLIQVILVATPEQWKVVQEKDRRFADLFQVFRVDEPRLDKAVKMVVRQRKLLELEHNSHISIKAISQLFTIQRNYLRRKALPGSVMKLLQQLAVKYKYSEIDAEEVRQEFEQYSGLHQKIFDESYTLEENEVRNYIAARLIGQKNAVDCLTDVIHVIKSKLNNPDKPLGSFMFIGPTGVGKTQAAKVLCTYLMGNEDHLMRFDMNEYIDAHAIQRLIGDYYNPEGQLTGKVRYKPFGVILFDEIEKAHPKVHDLLLQVLDDGRLTDSLGRTVDFSNTIIIMTSNVGARKVSMQVGYKTTTTDESAVYRKAVENRFRPEFINRIDRIVIFNPLELPHILSIARLQIDELLRRDGFVRRTTILSISSEALEWVARRGFDSKMGGRALKRQIERDLTTLSAEQLIATHSDQPIIFKINYNDNQLIPSIVTLDFATPYPDGWLPKIPSEKEGRRFYGHLLHLVQQLHERIRDAAFEEEENAVIDTSQNDQLDWQAFAFKDRITDLLYNLQKTFLGFRNRFYISAPVIPFRLKRVGAFIERNDNSWGRKERRLLQDKFFQKEALDELRDGYRLGIAEFDKLQTQFLDNYLEVAMLRLFSKGFLQKKSDKVTLHFQSFITNLGKTEVEFLMKRYEALLKGMDISCDKNEEKQTITADGHSLYELLKGEDGIHLFYIARQNPLPVRLEVHLVGVSYQPKDKIEVIRLYDGTSTLTDLRTGYTNDVNITASEFKLLLYAGLDEAVRAELTDIG